MGRSGQLDLIVGIIISMPVGAGLLDYRCVCVIRMAEAIPAAIAGI
jgi:hypothetical protein